MGEDLYKCTVNMITEKMLIYDEELIFSHEVDNESAFNDVETDEEDVFHEVDELYMDKHDP